MTGSGHVWTGPHSVIAPTLLFDDNNEIEEDLLDILSGMIATSPAVASESAIYKWLDSEIKARPVDPAFFYITPSKVSMLFHFGLLLGCSHNVCVICDALCYFQMVSIFF